MKNNSFPNLRENAIATAEALATIANGILEDLHDCTPETAGEILEDVMKASGAAQLLLIDFVNLSQAE